MFYDNSYSPEILMSTSLHRLEKASEHFCPRVLKVHCFRYFWPDLEKHRIWMIASKSDFGNVLLFLSFYRAPFPILYSPTGPLPSFFSCWCSCLTLFPLHKHKAHRILQCTVFLSLYTSPAQKHNFKDPLLMLLQIVILTASLVIWIRSLVQDGVSAYPSLQQILSGRAEKVLAAADCSGCVRHSHKQASRLSVFLTLQAVELYSGFPLPALEYFLYLVFLHVPQARLPGKGCQCTCPPVRLWGLCC